MQCADHATPCVLLLPQADRAPRAENVEGSFFVDATCIDCDTCRMMAPATFSRIGQQSAVHQQPTDKAGRVAALQALFSCPTCVPVWAAVCPVCVCVGRGGGCGVRGRRGAHKSTSAHQVPVGVLPRAQPHTTTGFRSTCARRMQGRCGPRSRACRGSCPAPAASTPTAGACAAARVPSLLDPARHTTLAQTAHATSGMVWLAAEGAVLTHLHAPTPPPPARRQRRRSVHSIACESYLIVRPQHGNVLVDTPRFNPVLAKRLTELGGVKYIFLTHKVRAWVCVCVVWGGGGGGVGVGRGRSVARGESSK
jgi:hypothetical protein